MVSPSREWGTLYDGLELERAFERIDARGGEDYAFEPDEGRETFECPCGGAIWVASRRGATGHWFTRDHTVVVLDTESSPWT